MLEPVELAPPIALETGFGAAVCDLLDERGLALYNLSTDDRADELPMLPEEYVACEHGD